MAILEKHTQDKIDKLSNESYKRYEVGDKETSYRLMEEAWGMYPNPKENWNESYNTAKYALDDLLKNGEIEKAMIWYTRMVKIHENLGLWIGSFEYYSGKIFFEKKDFKKSLEYFNKMFEIAGHRYFEDENSKYKDFYLNPEKYTNE